MREIKFRTFGRGGMCESMDIRDMTYCVASGDDEYYPSDTIFMQYTGLKDKNGVEIYEGDIITPRFPEDPDIYSAVIFEDGSFRKKYSDWDASLPCPVLNQYEVDLLNITIVGNIYENPELLQEPE